MVGLEQHRSLAAEAHRREFIKYAATFGAFTVPFVTSFTPQRGLRFGLGRASAQYGDGGDGGSPLDRLRERREAFQERIRERQRAFQERVRERQEAFQDRIREREEAAEQAAERLRSLLDRIGMEPPAAE